MARKPRIHFPGAIYHVIIRGNAGQDVFFNHSDRYRLYLILQCAVEKFGCRIHGFCLMTNHIHLVIQVGEAPLSRVMQNISLRFTKWINYTQSRSGHLFQGRYRAILIDADSYLLELVRYIHLNPVRAGLVALPNEYPWTAHRAYCGIEALPWLTTEWVMGILSSRHDKARSAYRTFVKEGMAERRRDEFHCGTWEGRLLGDDTFIDSVLQRSNQRRNQMTIADVLAAVCRRYGMTVEELRVPGKARPYSEARAVASLLVQERPHLSLTELGRALNRDIPSLGRVGRRLNEQTAMDPQLATMIEKVRGELPE